MPLSAGGKTPLVVEARMESNVQVLIGIEFVKLGGGTGGGTGGGGVCAADIKLTWLSDSIVQDRLFTTFP